MKRLSAVETLGSTTVICTDKTGTLTRNQMRVTALWTPAGTVDVDPQTSVPIGVPPPGAVDLMRAASLCSNAELAPEGEGIGDATEVALLLAAKGLGVDVSETERADGRRHLYHFDTALRMMSTVDATGERLVVHVKGAPEEVLRHCVGLGDRARAEVNGAVAEYAGRGLRVLAIASRDLTGAIPDRREDAEADLTLLGLAAMFDPPRPEVARAVQDCHHAGIRIIIVTGDLGLTAAEIARQVGIVRGRRRS